MFAIPMPSHPPPPQVGMAIDEAISKGRGECNVIVYPDPYNITTAGDSPCN